MRREAKQRGQFASKTQFKFSCSRVDTRCAVCPAPRRCTSRPRRRSRRRPHPHAFSSRTGRPRAQSSRARTRPPRMAWSRRRSMKNTRTADGLWWQSGPFLRACHPSRAVGRASEPSQAASSSSGCGPQGSTPCRPCRRTWGGLAGPVGWPAALGEARAAGRRRGGGAARRRPGHGAPGRRGRRAGCRPHRSARAGGRAPTSFRPGSFPGTASASPIPGTRRRWADRPMAKPIG